MNSTFAVRSLTPPADPAASIAAVCRQMSSNSNVQWRLAEAMGVQRSCVNELCNGLRNATAAPALILARVFGHGRNSR